MNSYGERDKSLGRGEMRNCRRCGKVFISFGSPICPECIDREEQQYEIVRKFLQEHPNVSVTEVSENTGVPPELIMEFLRRGLLMSLPDAQVGEKSTCIICKRPLESGRICPQCQKALLGFTKDTKGQSKEHFEVFGDEGGRVKRVSSGMPKDPGAKMYTIDLIRKKKP